MEQRWTKNEIDYLINSYATETIANIIANIKRPWNGIKVKASRLGLNRKELIVPPQMLEDYKVLSFKELKKKYSIATTSLYRIIRKEGSNTKRELTDFGSDLSFKENYLSKSIEELKTLYDTNYDNIKAKASRLNLKRPANLIPRKKSVINLAQLKIDYLDNNLTSVQISEKYFNNKTSRSHISTLLRDNNIIKDKGSISLQQIETKIKKYGSAFPGRRDSKPERELRDWLNSFGFNFKSTYKILNGKEIDCYDPTLKLGVEYCGLRYHHEDSQKVRRSTSYHNDKRIKCEEQGIRLITIFEDEWIYRKEQVKGFIKAAIHKNNRIVYARKCKVREIQKSEGNKFFDAFHIQGANNLGKYFVGLFFEEELIGAMSLGRHNRVSDKLTLDRLSFKEDVSVIGGSSKLFKFLLKLTNVRELLSWSDNRWSQGNVYPKLGFILEKETRPDFSYVDTSRPFKRVSKQSQTKNISKRPKGMTEREWANEQGLHLIWDCGKKVWKFNLNK